MGDNEATIQQVYIGFVGYKPCGKPVCIEHGITGTGLNSMSS